MSVYVVQSDTTFTELLKCHLLHVLARFGHHQVDFTTYMENVTNYGQNM
jgi:hypothetical protein